jgi:hypothetical protein
MPGIGLPVRLPEWHARCDAHKPDEKATVEIKSKSSKNSDDSDAEGSTPG